MEKIKNRSDLSRAHPREFAWLRKYKPELLVQAFGDPEETKAAKIKKTIIAMAKDGKERPVGRNELAIYLSKFINKNSNFYDSNFVNALNKIAPLWTLSRALRKEIVVENHLMRLFGEEKFVWRYKGGRWVRPKRKGKK